jgi:hypothetical protein
MRGVQFGDGRANHRNEEGWQRRTRCSQLRHHVCLHLGTPASLTRSRPTWLVSHSMMFSYIPLKTSINNFPGLCNNLSYSTPPSLRPDDICAVPSMGQLARVLEAGVAWSVEGMIFVILLLVFSFNSTDTSLIITTAQPSIVCLSTTTTNQWGLGRNQRV